MRAMMRCSDEEQGGRVLMQSSDQEAIMGGTVMDPRMKSSDEEP